MTDLYDPYALGVVAEIMSLACIKNGFNPIGAGKIIPGAY